MKRSILVHLLPFLIVFALLSVNSLHADPATPWTVRAIANLDACNDAIEQSLHPLQPQAIITYDRKFASLLTVYRRYLPTLSQDERPIFSARLDYLAQAHIRYLDRALSAMQRHVRAQIDQADRYEARNRHEDTLDALQDIEDALRCWR